MDDDEELDNLDIENEDENVDENVVENVVEQIEPRVGMEFNGIDEMYEFYKNYAKGLGFPVRKRSGRRNVEGNIRSVTISCSRAGTYESNTQNPLKPQATSRTGCTAHITARVDMNGGCLISVVAIEHNHEISPSKSHFFRCNRRMSEHIKHQLNLNDESGIRMNKSFGSLVQEAGGHDNLSCSQKDCRNYVEESRRLRLGEGDACAIMKYFSRMVAENLGFYFDIELDNESHLKNIFLADSRSREAYKEFGEVISFDTTYLTNKYDMPFAPFVGVNHHGQSILLGCALISKEDTDTFVWLFRKWLECMDGRAPQGIITDQARAMKNAIEIAFPNTRHRWCLWHIMKKLSEKLGRYNAFEAISSTMKRVVYDTQTTVDFEVQWNDMLDTFGLEESAWLKELYEERARWVPCYVKNSFWAGMSTTQRSESMNAFFDGYVNSKTSLKMFVEQYENALRSKVEKETRADADSLSKQIPTATNYLMEKQIQGVYTLSKFKEFQTELTGMLYCAIVNYQKGQGLIVYTVKESLWLPDGKVIPKFFNVSFQAEVCEANCSCQLFVFKGIICRHALTIFIHHEVSVLPEKYILRRWRKDVRRAHSKMKVKFNSWENTTAELRYRELCIAFSEVADLAAPISQEYDNVKEWINNKFKSLQLIEGSQKGKEILQPDQSVEEENTVEEDISHTILDPHSRTRKGRPKKNIMKPVSRRSKKKFQDGVGSATQESFVSNPVMVQSDFSQPWGVYRPPQQFTHEMSLMTQFQMSEQLHAMGVPPTYENHYFPPQSYLPPHYPHYPGP